MGWKKITYFKHSQQLDLFSEPEETPPPSKKRKRSEFYFLQPYTARDSSTCNTFRSECHKGGQVEEGDKMIVAIPMKGVKGPRFYFHEGACSDTGIKRIDEEADREIRSR